VRNKILLRAEKVYSKEGPQKKHFTTKRTTNTSQQQEDFFVLQLRIVLIRIQRRAFDILTRVQWKATKEEKYSQRM
jgi:hypothetical protein